MPSDEARAHVVAGLTLRYERAHARVVTALDSERYLGLVDRLQALAAEPPLTSEADRPHRRRHAPAASATTGSGCAAGSAPRTVSRTRPGGPRPCTRCARRPSGLRYAVEPLVPAYGKHAKRLVKRLKGVQSTLGDHHDCLVARAELPQLARRAASDGVDVYALGVLHVRLEERAAAAEAGFEEVWRRASRKKLRSWLS